MAFSSERSDAALSDINITPLVDVMLVLLVIFMVTMPLAARQIQLDMPQSTTLETPNDQIPPIHLTVDVDGHLRWDGSTISASELGNRFALEAARERPAILEIDANPEAAYELVMGVLASARNAGLQRIGFVGAEL